MKWFRFWNDTINDVKILQLSDYEYRMWTYLLSYASASDCVSGEFQVTFKLLSLHFHQRFNLFYRSLQRLHEVGLIEISGDDSITICNWSKRQLCSDSSTERVKKYRDKRESLGLTKGVSYDIKATLERDGYACVYCGKEENLCVDHAYPITKGGTDDGENLVTACKECNSGKSGRTPEEAGFKWLNMEARNRYLLYVAKRTFTPNVTVTETAPETDTDTDTNKPPIPPKKTGGKKVSSYSEEFMLFWDAYPRKVGKDKAWKAWLARNGDRPELSDILDAVKKQSLSQQWRKDGGQYIPHPSTWINAGRWSDEEDLFQAKKEAWEV